MKKVLILLLSILATSVSFSQIIADHTVVGRYGDIPQHYIDEVKKMWLVYPGESHSGAIRDGLRVMESSFPAYAVSVTESGTPEPYTASNLRVSRATWGDYSNSTGWIYSYGEEDWFTSAQAISRTKAGIAYCNTHSLTISAMGFGWCWDPGVSVNDYLSATQSYIDYCNVNSIPTKVFFTTGPVDDGLTAQEGYYKSIDYTAIRTFVRASSSRVLFDYSDILCYDDNGATSTRTWDGHTYPFITATNQTPDVGGYHISEAGAVRLAKAMWWMLARMAGWDGSPSVSTWTGGTADWSTPANWSGGIVPGSTTDVIIPASGTNPVISATTTARCNNLTVGPGAVLTVQSSSLTLNGSLKVDGTSVGAVTYNRFMRNDDKHFFSSPVGGSISDFESAHSVEVFEWDEVNGIWDPSLSETEFLRGKGYAWDQAAPAARTVAFTGTIVKNAGPINATAPYDNTSYLQTRDTWGGGGWNLLGNPFTSPLDAAAFISENSLSFDASYKALYVYDGLTMQYKWVSSVAPTYGFDGYFDQYVQAGQGFFVLAAKDGVSFSFNSGMQAVGPAVPMLKSAGDDQVWPGLQLKVRFGEKERSAVVVYNYGMTAGLDPGYDIGQLSAGPEVEIYTSLVEKDNDVNFAQQALPLTDLSKNIVPVGIDTEKGGEVTFSALTVPIGNSKFWFEDRTAGIITDLSSKSYTVTLPAGTYGTGRFFIHASVIKPVTPWSLTEESNDIHIWGSVGKVVVKGEVSSSAVCSVFTMGGEMVIESRLSDGGMNTLTMPSSSKGIYLVRVSDGLNVYTGKVIIL